MCQRCGKPSRTKLEWKTFNVREEIKIYPQALTFSLKPQILLLYLPTQIRFLIGGERVTCHWSKLHDALGRTKLHDALGQQQLELSTHTWSGRAPLKRRQICTPADVKQIIFICVLFYFELGGITKHLMTGPTGNSEFCFPSTSMFPSASPRGTLRVSGKQNSLFPLGPDIKCLLFHVVVLLTTAKK